MADLIRQVDDQVNRGFQNSGDGSYAEVVIATSDQVQHVTATITAGTSITGDIDLGQYRMVRISIPAGWTTADLTFQVSSTSANWRNLYDMFGTEYKVVASTGDRSVIVPVGDTMGIRLLRIRSGTSAAPVAQTTDMALVLTVVR